MRLVAQDRIQLVARDHPLSLACGQHEGMDSMRRKRQFGRPFMVGLIAVRNHFGVDRLIEEAPVNPFFGRGIDRPGVQLPQA